MTQTVLLVGATGRLGSRIAHHLLRREGVDLRLLVRAASAKRGELQPLLDAGAKSVEGDVKDASSLDRATRGVDVVVSAVQGGPDVIVDGQAALAQAAKANGARRILPSDFGLDLFKATPGEHPPFNWRQEADRRIAETGIEQVNVLQGAFMDLFGPGSPFVDYAAGVVSFWGDGHRPIEVTTIEDTARIAARVALDREVPAGKFTFWGDRRSFDDVARAAETSTGRPFTRRSLGDEAALRTAMAAADPAEAMMLAYSLYMANGQTSMDVQMADRYPDVVMEKLEDMLADRMSGAA